MRQVLRTIRRAEAHRAAKIAKAEAKAKAIFIAEYPEPKGKGSKEAKVTWKKMLEEFVRDAGNYYRYGTGFHNWRNDSYVRFQNRIDLRIGRCEQILQSNMRFANIGIPVDKNGRVMKGHVKRQTKASARGI